MSELNKIYDALEDIRDCNETIKDIALSLAHLGLPIGKEMLVISRSINTRCDTISLGVGEMIDDRMSDAQQATGNMIKAALAGIKLKDAS